MVWFVEGIAADCEPTAFQELPYPRQSHFTPDGAKKKPRYRKQHQGQVNQGSWMDCITQKAKPPALLHAGGFGSNILAELPGFIALPNNSNALRCVWWPVLISGILARVSRVDAPALPVTSRCSISLRIHHAAIIPNPARPAQLFFNHSKTLS